MITIIITTFIFIIIVIIIIIIIIVVMITVETPYKKIWYNKMPDVTNYFLQSQWIVFALFCIVYWL